MRTASSRLASPRQKRPLSKPIIPSVIFSPRAQSAVKRDGASLFCYRILRPKTLSTSRLPAELDDTYSMRAWSRAACNLTKSRSRDTHMRDGGTFAFSPPRVISFDTGRSDSQPAGSTKKNVIIADRKDTILRHQKYPDAAYQHTPGAQAAQTREPHTTG